MHFEVLMERLATWLARLDDEDGAVVVAQGDDSSGGPGPVVGAPQRALGVEHGSGRRQPPLRRCTPQSGSARPAAAWAVPTPGPRGRAPRAQAAGLVGGAFAGGVSPPARSVRTPRAGPARARWSASSPGASPAGRVSPARVSTASSPRSLARAPAPAP
ncbi:hypothetical protein STENM223S_02085 [Streptomyces tendae]